MKIIGIVHSPFKEKFAIPRQPGLISTENIIELIAPYNRHEALEGIEEYSHVWILFLFHQNEPTNENHLSVRPPRLGGNIKRGVFATRSPFRPNNIGLSVVKIKHVDREKNLVTVIGGDFLDQTPVVDIKPYIKEIDSIENAQSSFTDSIIEKKLEVIFSPEAEAILSLNKKNEIAQILGLDPRPRYHEDTQKHYAFKFYDYDIHWRIEGNIVQVLKVIRF
jgi:tRNA-Thr(GGU) m(6)t(6)A37 methyltransferase TsaA